MATSGESVNLAANVTTTDDHVDDVTPSALIIDHNHPLFLYPSDTPALSLITQMLTRAETCQFGKKPEATVSGAERFTYNFGQKTNLVLLTDLVKKSIMMLVFIISRTSVTDTLFMPG